MHVGRSTIIHSGMNEIKAQHGIRPPACPAACALVKIHQTETSAKFLMVLLTLKLVFAHSEYYINDTFR